MAGIYLHIPYCKQACHYCDFHFSTVLKNKNSMIAAMKKEIEIRKHYLEDAKIETIYFGGGTPSILSVSELQDLMDAIFSNFEVENDVEVTLEANPDDLKAQKVKELRNTIINRFSIGIQSFFEEDLKWMNRVHNAQEADSCVKIVQDAGFDNLNLDLIYGFPLLSDEKWRQNIQKIIDLKVPHISAYSMTVEGQTALAHFIQKGIQKPMDEQQSAEQFQLLMHILKKEGYDHYEVSNFAFPNRYSKHNTSYWKGIPYIGIGPSAHSFHGQERQWNIRNNALYIKNISENLPFFEKEILKESDQFNEYLLTHLRTKWGIDTRWMAQQFPNEMNNSIVKPIKEFKRKGWIVEESPHQIRLTEKGFLYADYISSELFYLES